MSSMTRGRGDSRALQKRLGKLVQVWGDTTIYNPVTVSVVECTISPGEFRWTRIDVYLKLLYLPLRKSVNIGNITVM